MSKDYRNKNIFEVNADIIVSWVNADGVFVTPLELEFKNRFSRETWAFRNSINKDNEFPYEFSVTKDGKIILFISIRKHWYSPISKYAVVNGLKFVRDTFIPALEFSVRQYKLKKPNSIAFQNFRDTKFPFDNIEWDKFKEIAKDILGDELELIFCEKGVSNFTKWK